MFYSYGTGWSNSAEVLAVCSTLWTDGVTVGVLKLDESLVTCAPGWERQGDCYTECYMAAKLADAPCYSSTQAVDRQSVVVESPACGPPNPNPNPNGALDKMWVCSHLHVVLPAAVRGCGRQQQVHSHPHDCKGRGQHVQQRGDARKVIQVLYLQAHRVQSVGAGAHHEWVQGADAAHSVRGGAAHSVRAVHSMGNQWHKQHGQVACAICASSLGKYRVHAQTGERFNVCVPVMQTVHVLVQAPSPAHNQPVVFTRTQSSARSQ